MRKYLPALVLLFAAGCSGSAPANETHQVAGAPAARLSPYPETLLTALYEAAPRPLEDQQLCENAGMCDDSAKQDLFALIEAGLVEGATANSYQITKAGREYVDRHFEVLREGDLTTFTTREDQ